MAKESLIYIMTNPGLPENVVKIGYTKDLKGRRGNFNTAAIEDFEVFATYDVPNIKKHMPDKLLHNLMTALNPGIKPNPKKEFFNLYPEQAYDILENIALIHDRLDALHLEGEYNPAHSFKGKKKKASPTSIPNLKGNKYYCGEATLVSSGDGQYTLCSGSILKNWNGNEENLRFKRQQDNLIDSGAVKIINGKMVTQVNLPFKSPSGAIYVVLCYSENGWRKWKTKDGKSIDELERNK